MGIFSLVHIRESEVREMTIKYSKVLAIAGVALLTSMMVAPSHAEDPVVPVATTAVSTKGTIQVISQVNNDNGGTKLPTDFTFNVKHFGTDVLGSPFLGIDITNGFIDLQAGQNVTIIRTFNDNGTGPVVVVDEPTTENGGVLPNTATPWFNFLLVGSLVAAAGSFGILKSINLHKATK